MDLRLLKNIDKVFVNLMIYELLLDFIISFLIRIVVYQFTRTYYRKSKSKSMITVCPQYSNIQLIRNKKNENSMKKRNDKIMRW
jgi:hypothetical protein